MNLDEVHIIHLDMNIIFFFTVRTIHNYKKLLRVVIESLSLEVFKVQLDRVLHHLI